MKFIVIAIRSIVIPSQFRPILIMMIDKSKKDLDNWLYGLHGVPFKKKRRTFNQKPIYICFTGLLICAHHLVLMNFSPA